jgi:hypothetical protein
MSSARLRGAFSALARRRNFDGAARIDSAFLNLFSQISRAGATREKIDCVLLVAHAVRAHCRTQVSAGFGRTMLGVEQSRNGSDCG